MIQRGKTLFIAKAMAFEASIHINCGANVMFNFIVIFVKLMKNLRKSSFCSWLLNAKAKG
jgi:hypothetical protein